MGGPPNKSYKRSWKNLLINKRYQLRFTLFMVGVSALLMACLGWWVMKEADQATEVGINNVLGRECPPPPSLAASTRAQPTAVVVDDVTQMKATPGAEPAAAPGAAAPAEPGSAAGPPVPPPDGDPARKAPVVTLDESTMKSIPPPPPPVDPGYVSGLVSYQTCQIDQLARIESLHAGRTRILLVLIAVGLLLCVGLAVYGIKMTHKVAGPLHKVTLYFNKMRDGKLDTVYSLRKGDQLVDFYEHFKLAHGGVQGMQRDDIARLRATIDAADVAELAARSPEIAAALDDLRAMLARKEASLE
jgi:hypothetical protein